MTAGETSEKKERPRASILIPTYGAAALLRTCLESLARYAPERCTVYVLDDATPDGSIRELCEELGPRFSRLRYVRSEVNRGFVGTCNWGCEHFREPGHDVLLLNSDTEVTAGFLDEMQDVLHLHEKHGVVTPRTNNATIFSVPWSGRRLPPQESYETWLRLRELLPRFQVMPTAVGYCMLVKSEVLDRFELFDEIYSPGYNEENDFVCRINRYGYSAIAANRAFVFHYETSTFGPRRAELERVNRAVLLERYPEYARKVDDYGRFHVDPVENFAGLLVPHKPRILYDLFHLPAAHNGTADFGLNLLRQIRQVANDEFELFVGVGPAHTFFMHELAGYRIYEDRPEAQMTFDLVFRPSQVFHWYEFRRMNRLAPRVSYVLQDIITVRCDYLNQPHRQILFRQTAELSDEVFTISDFSRRDFNAFYGMDIPMRVIHHGTNAGMTRGEFHDGEYVLVMGNAYAHKGVGDALRYLNGKWPVVVLGGEKSIPDLAGNVRWLTSGKLSRQSMRQLLVKAKVLVYPSHYEGFGLPVMDALALGKPVVVLDSAVNRELETDVGSGDICRVRTLKELPDAVERVYDRDAVLPEREPRRWRTAAEEYVAAFREILARDLDTAKIRRRWELLRTIDCLQSLKE